jgi:hypothetical protein
VIAARAPVALAALLLVGCPGAINDPAPFVAARLEANAPAHCPDGVTATALFAQRCATSGCHDARTQLINLDLQSPGVAARLIGQSAAACGGRTLADPNDPDRSALLLKLRASPPCGDRMPLGAPAFTAAETACVRGWILRRGEEADAGDEPDAAPDASSPLDAAARDDLSR